MIIRRENRVDKNNKRLNVETSFEVLVLHLYAFGCITLYTVFAENFRY